MKAFKGIAIALLVEGVILADAFLVALVIHVLTHQDFAAMFGLCLLTMTTAVTACLVSGANESEE